MTPPRIVGYVPRRVLTYGSTYYPRLPKQKTQWLIEEFVPAYSSVPVLDSHQIPLEERVLIFTLFLGCQVAQKPVEAQSQYLE